MNLTRKVNELVHGRALIFRDEQAFQGNHADWETKLHDYLHECTFDKNDCIKIAFAEYKFNAVNHTHQDTKTDVWLQNLNRDSSLNFKNAHSDTVIQAIVESLIIYRRGLPASVFVRHDVYSKLSDESHYVDLEVRSSLKYVSKYKILNDSSREDRDDSIVARACMRWYAKK
jgi:hypothetical protein